MKLYKIEADDVVLYHKTFYVEANSIKEAKQKMAVSDYWDSETSETRGESTFEKTRIISIEETKAKEAAK
tara:strand:+ start:283 stop:492 length:210 start_codon:yes stop_codon:yes gene_type:complete